MLFSKALFTTFTLAAMAISHVASAPTAQPETAVVVKHTSIVDTMNTCYSQVQTHCSNIGVIIDHCGGVVNEGNATAIGIELTAIKDLVVVVIADIKVAIAAGVSGGDLCTCGNTFILLVNLLVSILIRISGACQPGAISVLSAIVASLLSTIQSLAGVLIIGIEDLLGLLGILLGVLFGLLGSLKININVCISALVSACGPY